MDHFIQHIKIYHMNHQFKVIMITHLLFLESISLDMKPSTKLSLCGYRTFKKKKYSLDHRSGPCSQF